MTEPQGSELFPTPDPVEADRQRDLTTGLLPSQLLREAVAQGREILSPQPIGDDQIQPAGFELLPGGHHHELFVDQPDANSGDRPLKRNRGDAQRSTRPDD